MAITAFFIEKQLLKRHHIFLLSLTIEILLKIKLKATATPGSVFGSHLSRRPVARPLQPPPEDGRASHMSSHGVAPDRVYSIGQSPADG